MFILIRCAGFSPDRVSSPALVTPAPCFQTASHLFPLMQSPAAAQNPTASLSLCSRASWAVINRRVDGFECDT